MSERSRKISMQLGRGKACTGVRKVDGVTFSVNVAVDVPFKATLPREKMVGYSKNLDELLRVSLSHSINAAYMVLIFVFVYKEAKQLTQTRFNNRIF